MTTRTTLHTSLATLALALALAAPTAFAQSTLYYSGGSNDIANGTPVVTNFANLSGSWGGATKNFATDTNGTTYSAWVDGSVFSALASGWSTTNGQQFTNNLIANVSAAGIAYRFDSPTAAAMNQNKAFYINATNVSTLTLSGSSPVIDARMSGLFLGGNDTVSIVINQSVSGTTKVQLAGSNGFTKTGNLTLQLNNTNDALTGTVNINHNATSIDGGSAGSVRIGQGGGNAASTLAGIARFNVSAVGYTATGSATAAGNRSRLAVLTGTNNANQLNDTAVISLTGLGQFEYQGRSNFSETISQLRLASSGVLNLGSFAAGTTPGALTFTSGIDRANNRAQLHVFTTPTNTTANGEFSSTVNLGTSHGLGTSVLPWATDSRARFLKVDGSNFLVTNSPTDVTDVSTITSSTTDYRITGNTNNATFASGAQANTLGIYRGSNSAYGTFTVADTLTIASGGLVVANDNGNQAATISGGTSLTTANSNTPLYITVGVASAGSGLAIQTPITGGMDVAILGGNGGVTFGSFATPGGAPNTYTGTTYVNGGTLTLSKSNNVNAVGSNVVVRNGGILASGQNNQIPDGATVTIENGGFWNRGGSSEIIASLAGGGMLTANTNSTALTTITNSVTPGDSGIGTMIVSSASNAGITNAFRLNSGAVFNFELSGSGGTSDQIQFWNFSTNEFVLNNNAINLTLSGSQVAGTYTVSLFKFYSDSGTTLTAGGITTGLTIGTIGSGITNTPTLNYNSGGNTIDLTYDVVPEPSTLAMLALSGVALAAYRLRRRNR